MEKVESGRSRQATAVEQIGGRRRDRDSSRRPKRLTPRFSVRELSEIEAAAWSVGMTVTGFCAEVTVAAARGAALAMGARQDRETLARLQRELFQARTAVNRFGGNVNQAMAAFHALGEPPTWLRHAVAACLRSVRQVDEVVGQVHRRLR